MVALLVTSFMTQSSLAAGKSEDDVCVSKEDSDLLAKHIQKCELYRLNYQSTQAALDKALSEKRTDVYQDKTIVTTGLLLAFGIGILFGANFNRP